MSKITSILFLLISFCGFSQETKSIHGKVSYLGSYQKNIDIINFTTKNIVQTNSAGEFDIEAKAKDALILMSENFADQKYVLTAEDIEKGSVLINLIEKPIPLEEVEIQQIRAIKVAAVSDDDIKMAKIAKESSGLKVEGVYTGEMPYAADLMQIGKLVGKLFKSKKPKDLKAEPLPFKEYAKANFNESFFTKTLKLKPEETPRFLEYCEADPKSKNVTQGNDELAILEFLLTKKSEFDKLK